MLPRIYADFNGLGNSSRYPGRLEVPLDVIGSLRYLSNAGLRLRDGLRIQIYDWSDEEEDLEADATVYFCRRRKVWVALLDETGCDYVPKRDRTPDCRLLCLNCRRDLASSLVKISARWPDGDPCPFCGTPANAALAPPGTYGEPEAE